MAGRKQFHPEAALDAAIRVFWEQSYSAASISDLVTATGLSRASLYGTFGDKEELFLAGLRRYVERTGEASRAAIGAAGGGVRAQVAAGFDAVLDRMADPAQPDGCLLAQTAAESGALGQPIQAAVRQILDREVDRLHQLLLPHVPPGADTDARSLAHFLVATAQALAVMHRAGTSVAELRRTAALALRVLDVLTP